MPKVALHDESNRLGIFRSAVMSTPVDEIAKALVVQANRSHPRAIQWLEPLVDSGPTNAFLRKLDVAVQHVELRTRVELEGDSKRRARNFELSQASFAGSELELFSLAVIRILMDDYVDRLHRCQLEDCRRYFVGDPRSKWCSKNCGSTYRVRDKRKRARQ